MIIKNINELVRTVLPMAAIIAFAASCTRSDINSVSPVNSGEVWFNVDNSNTTQITKSGNRNHTETNSLKIEIAEGMNPMFLTSDVSDLTLADEESKVSVTKGTPLTTENFGQMYGNFVVNAKEELTDLTFFMNDELVTYNSTAARKWNTSKVYYWPNADQQIRFWFYSPKELSYETTGSARTKPLIDYANSKIAFSYSADYGKTSGTSSIDATRQPDLLFAYQPWSRSQNNGEVKVIFDHALSGVRFVAGSTDECKIISIELTNLYSSADCEYTPIDKTMPDKFTWSNLSNMQNVKQTFNAELEKSTDEQQITDSDGTKVRTFMAIPQQLDESDREVEAIIEYTVSTKTTTKTVKKAVKLPMPSGQSSDTWYAGKMYTYKLTGFGNRLKIDVTDEVADKKKQNLKIINTYEYSDVKCFIRAMIIGNWFASEKEEGSQKVIEKVVAPWTVNDAGGLFTPVLPSVVGTPGNNWTLGADGYYYYKYPVYPGDETYDKLFETYDAPENQAIDNSYLKINIVAQGIKWDKDLELVKKAWGSTVAGYLSVEDREDK